MATTVQKYISRIEIFDDHLSVVEARQHLQTENAIFSKWLYNLEEGKKGLITRIFKFWVLNIILLCGKMKSSSEYFVNIYWRFRKNLHQQSYKIIFGINLYWIFMFEIVHLQKILEG